MRRHPMYPRNLALVVLAALLTLAGCSGLPEREFAAAQIPAAVPDDPPVGEWADESAALPPLELGAEPLWESDNVSSTSFVDGALVLSASSYVAVLDPATGASTWSRYRGDLLAGDDVRLLNDAVAIEADGGGLVIVTYYRSLEEFDPPTEFGVAALRVSDGTLAWTAPLPADITIEGEDDIGFRIAYADSTTAFATVAPWESVYGSAVEQGRVHSVAVDVATGEVTWTRTGVWVVAASGGTALAVAAGISPKASATPGGTALAYDRDDGTHVWTHAVAGASGVVLVAGDYALIREDLAAGETRHVVVDAATGEAIADLGADLEHCVGDGGLVACMLSDPHAQEPDRIVTVNAATAEVSVGRLDLPPDATSLSGVAEGYIFVRGSEVGDEQAPYYAVDPTGAVVSEQLPGRFSSMSGEYAVFDVLGDSAMTGLVAYAVPA